MRPHGNLLVKPAQGWLVACVMAALFVLMGASGDDVFARHVGTSVSAAGTPDTAADIARPAVSSDAQPVAAVPAGRSSHGTGEAGDPAHVLHLLGACLAILCAGALFLRRRGLLPWSVRASAALVPRPVFPASWLACVRRGPPRLTPPRFSPVIRT
jgi:hypothetical protein